MKLTIGRKLGIGFTTIVLLFALTYGVSSRAAKRVKTAEEEAGFMVDSAGFLTEKQVDHLAWLDQLNTTFVNNLHHVSVQTDDHKCGLGKWLHGPEAEALASRDATAGRLIEAIKQPHAELHATAVRIREQWRPVHEGLIDQLRRVHAAHLAWAGKVAAAIATDAEKADVQTDPTQCALGQFLLSAEYQAWSGGFPELADAMSAADEPHKTLHHAAIDINAALAERDRAEASRLYDEVVLPSLAAIETSLEAAIHAEQMRIDAQVAARAVLREDTAACLASTQSAMGALQDHLEDRSESSVAEVHGSIAMLQRSTLTVAIVAVLTAIAAALLTTRSIVRPVRRLMRKLNLVREGDLTQRMHAKGTDEVKQLSDGFDELTDTLHDVIGRISACSNEVASSAAEIAASSEEMSSGMSNQNEQVSQISSAIEEMGASVTEVARKTSEAASAAEEAGQLAQDGGNVVRETIDGMQVINSTVSASAESVTELGRRGQQIGEVIDVINDIADQTNLLALNAAIEAARAGEHGRGFAVVADEVRKLADRTTSATQEVAGSIEAIQSETGRAVAQMNEGAEQVEAGVVKATQAGESLEHIVSGAEQVAGMIRDIAAAAEEQSAAGEQVARNIEAISAVTTQAAQGASQAATAAADLSQRAETMRQLVSRFTLENAGSYQCENDRTATAQPDDVPLEFRHAA